MLVHIMGARLEREGGSPFVAQKEEDVATFVSLPPTFLPISSLELYCIHLRLLLLPAKLDLQFSFSSSRFLSPPPPPIVIHHLGWCSMGEGVGISGSDSYCSNVGWKVTGRRILPPPHKKMGVS